MRRNLAIFLTSALLLAGVGSLHAQEMTALKPPPGAHVALIEFADMECPMCARQNPVLEDASAKYHVPWVRHDFPLPQHIWSKQAAVNARWFDTRSKKLGDDYRDAVFANQINIETKDDLRAFTEKFAQQHGAPLPFVLDPQDKLLGEVDADYNLGVRLGVHQTPTVWIVTDGTGGAARQTAVTDFNKLYTMLDEATAQTLHARR